MQTKNLVMVGILLLILIPFVTSIDINGDGIDDGEQDMCGDLVCQSWETEASCPGDCSIEIDTSVPPHNPTENISSTENQTETPETIPEENETVTETPETIQTENETTEEIPAETNEASKESFFSGTPFKIILGVVGLIIAGLIIFIIIRKIKSSSENAEIQVQQTEIPTETANIQ